MPDDGTPALLTRDKLILRALSALYRVATDAMPRPMAPTPLLRFSLAYLYSVSDGQVAPYQAFLREIQDERANEARGRYLRFIGSVEAWRAIVRGVGLDATPEFERRMAGRPG